MDGRPGLQLQADWGHISVLAGGGHICELNLNACDGVNPLWRPQWTTIDPFKYTIAKHVRKYGPPPDGRLLSGIAGHSLSFDHFGPPSLEETAAGLTTPGEAPVLMWDIQKQTQSPTPPKSKVQVRFLILLLAVPEAFRGVASVSMADERPMSSSPGGAAGSFQWLQTNSYEWCRPLRSPQRNAWP